MTTLPTDLVTSRPMLEIRITLTSGAVCRFAQDDPALVRQITAGFQPARLFAAPQLVLGGDGALSVFPTARVERVDLIGDDLPVTPFQGGATSVREITQDEFQTSYDPIRYAADRRQAGQKPGSAQIGFTEYWMASGSRLFWEVRMESQALMPVDMKNYIQALSAPDRLHARTSEGGVALLNPANLVRMTFHPGPPALPLGAWPTRRL